MNLNFTLACPAGRLCLLACCLLTLAMPTRGEDRQLVFLNWGEYMDPALLAAFEQHSGIKVREVYFSSDDHRNSLLAVADPGAYDVMLVTQSDVDSYVRRGWLAPLPDPRPANLKFLDMSRKEYFQVHSDHAVPFFWGTVGIAYRSDLLARPLDSWVEFFDPGSDLEGAHGMIGTVRELGGLAMKSLGYSTNSGDRNEIRQAAQVLRAHDSRVHSYDYAQLDQTAPLVRGDVVAAIMYSGDALLLKEYEPAIEYVIPREGGHLWLDFLAVSASSRLKREAWEFIDFLCDPRNSAQLTRVLSTATTNQAASRYLPESVLQNSVIFPDEDSLANSEIQVNLPPRAMNTMNSLLVPLLGDDSR